MSKFQEVPEVAQETPVGQVCPSAFESMLLELGINSRNSTGENQHQIKEATDQSINQEVLNLVQGLAAEAEIVENIDEEESPIEEVVAETIKAEKFEVLKEEKMSSFEINSQESEVTQQIIEIKTEKEENDEEMPQCMRYLSCYNAAENSAEDKVTKKDAVKRKLETIDANCGTESLEKKIKTEPDNEKNKLKLPNLDKYWKAVDDAPSDFIAWVNLVQFVDKEVSLIVAFLNETLLIRISFSIE